MIVDVAAVEGKSRIYCRLKAQITTTVFIVLLCFYSTMEFKFEGLVGLTFIVLINRRELTLRFCSLFVTFVDLRCARICPSQTMSLETNRNT